MGEKVKRYLSGRNFFYLVVVVFCVQAVWFAASIQYNIPPDESYHYNFISLYADRSLTAGPNIDHQPAGSFVLGDVQRAPSFLYHYLMSFPLKVIDQLTHRTTAKIFALRLIDICFSLVTLLLLRKVLKKAGLNDLITNLSVAAFSVTGMFVWISAAVNYDNLATLAWLGFLWSMLCFQDKPSLNNLLKIISLFLVATMVKIDFALVMILAILVYCFIARHRLGEVKKRLFADIRKSTKIRAARKKSTLILGIITILVGLLFISRIGENVIKYHAVTPACTALHTKAECMSSQIYSRDVRAEQSVRKYKAAGGQIDFQPIEFAASWVDVMYQRIIFYFGNKAIEANLGAELVFAASLVLAGCLLVVKRARITANNKQTLLLFSSLLFAAGLFATNLRTFLNIGVDYGFQGRYLLPVLPFLYAFTLKLIYDVGRSLPPIKRSALLTCCMVLALAFLYEDFPGIVFLKGSNPGWYSRPTTSLNLHLQHALKKTHLFYPSTLQS